jgi:branched-chain amino acid transport system permease protein
MNTFVSTAIFALADGAIYALMALGLTLVFGVMRSINFAHGELCTLGGYAFVVMGSFAPWMPPLVAVLAAPLIGFTLGWLLHRALLTPRATFSRFKYGDFVMVSTFAVSIIIQNALILTFGPAYVRPDSLLPGNFPLPGGSMISGDRLISAAGAVLGIAVVWWFLRSTQTGRAWRAINQNAVGAEVVGIDVRRSSRAAFATGCALAALSGGLFAPLFSVYPTAGIVPITKGFMIIILGGLGSVPGALVGGVLVGIADGFGAVYISTAYSDIYGFLLMLAILLIKPRGLFATAARQF